MHTNSPYLVHSKIFCHGRRRMLWYKSVLTAHKREKEGELKKERAESYLSLVRSLLWTFIIIQIEWPKKTCACRMNWYFRCSALLVFFFDCEIWIDTTKYPSKAHTYTRNDIFGACCWQQPLPTTNVVYKIRLHENCSHILNRTKYFVTHDTNKQTESQVDIYTKKKINSSLLPVSSCQCCPVLILLLCIWI